jgi:hypothetical protein
MAPKYHPTPLSGGDRKALQKELVKSRAMTGILAEQSEQKRRVDAIAWFRFEGVKLRLADNTFYTCDFAVMSADGTLEMHEVKGFWQDDARVKIKVAASMYPFRFIALKPRAKKHGGGWEVEEF